jgi:hypothetical protein
MVLQYSTEQINQSQKSDRLSMAYLVCGEQEDVRARRVHLVTLTRVDSLLLNGFNLERFKLLVENLTLEVTQLINPQFDSQALHSLNP